MSDRLINLLNLRVVLITTESGVGTGSFIAHGRVLTCAHVVRKAVIDGSTIQIQYTQLNQQGIWENKQASVLKTILSSNVIASDTPKPQGSGHNEEYPDIAILEIKVEGHAILKLPELNAVTPLSALTEYLAYGFQKQDRITGKMISQTISLNYDGMEDGMDEPKIIFENGVIRPGMSGGPLVERETGTLIGIVQMTRSSQDNHGAYVIPLESIWNQFAFWQEQKTNFIFNELKQKTHLREVQRGYSKDFPRFPYLKKNWPTLLLLCLALFLGLSWIFLHFGTVQNSVIFAALFVVLPIAGNILTQWSGQDAQNEVQGVRNSIGKLLSNQILLSGLLLLVVCLWVFVSSVWISYSPDSAYSLKVKSELPIQLKKEFILPKNKSLIHFLTLTWPGGTNYILEMEGMDTMHIKSFPLKRLSYIYPTDFQREPILFIRFHTDFLGTELLTTSELKIYKGKQNIYAAPSGILMEKGAILIGKRKLRIDSAIKDSWLIHGEMEGVPQDQTEPSIQAWENYLALDTIGIELNIPIRILISNPNNNTNILDTMIIPKDPLQHVFVKPKRI